MFSSTACPTGSTAKFCDVSLYRKYKYGGCKTGHGLASGSEKGRKDIADEYMHITE